MQTCYSALYIWRVSTLMTSEGSSIVHEEGGAKPWHEKLHKAYVPGEMTDCLGGSSSCESQPEPLTWEIRYTFQKVLGICVDGMLTDMRVEIAEDLHHHPGILCLPTSNRFFFRIFFFLKSTKSAERDHHSLRKARTWRFIAASTPWMGWST